MGTGCEVLWERAIAQLLHSHNGRQTNPLINDAWVKTDCVAIAHLHRWPMDILGDWVIG